MSTVISNNLKKFGSSEKLYFCMCILQTKTLTDNIFLYPSLNYAICYESTHKLKTTCQTNVKFGPNVRRKWNYKF